MLIKENADLLFSEETGIEVRLCFVTFVDKPVSVFIRGEKMIFCAFCGKIFLS
jgi:hypothetical protein